MFHTSRPLLSITNGYLGFFTNITSVRSAHLPRHHVDVIILKIKDCYRTQHSKTRCIRGPACHAPAYAGHLKEKDSSRFLLLTLYGLEVVDPVQ